MLVKAYAATVIGIDAALITVEVSCTRGLDFTMVGLPDSAVKESRERVNSALHVSGYSIPRKQVVVNFAPADLRKEGSAFDLPLAIALMAGDEQLPAAHLSEYMLLGELSLDGTLQPIKGALSMAICAKREGFKGLILPAQNAREAAVVKGLDVIGADTLTDVVRVLSDIQTIAPTEVDLANAFIHPVGDDVPDFSDVRGQYEVRRAMEVAAAGSHNLIMVGPPGAGKSMMAQRLPSILPPLTLDEALETTKIHSVAGLMARNLKMGELSAADALITRRPFRSPHHTITDVALIGGGTSPHPGEISLAHNGVLFLDELPEYKRTTLEVMRQPLEDRKITVSRAKMTVEYPASFMLVAAMNPCPCGHYGDGTDRCTCTPGQIHRYLSRISGPLLDRIDLQVYIHSVPLSELEKEEPGESSAAIRERVMRARAIQEARFRDVEGVHCNAQMSPKMIRKYCKLGPLEQARLNDAMVQMQLSARAYDRILRVARTIADLEGSENIQLNHIAEASSFRNLDKEGWRN